MTKELEALKYLKENERRHWLDFSINVPAWFKDKEQNKIFIDRSNLIRREVGPYEWMILQLEETFGKGNYVIIDTSGGYHILVKTSAIKSNPHKFCNTVKWIYGWCVRNGAEPYLDEKGNCKFECIVKNF